MKAMAYRVTIIVNSFCKADTSSADGMNLLGSGEETGGEESDNPVKSTLSRSALLAESFHRLATTYHFCDLIFLVARQVLF